MSDNTMQVKYGEFEIDFAKIPHTSLVAMLRRGVSHFFGNEMAAKVAAYYKPDRKAPEGEVLLPDTEENRAKLKAEFQKAAFDALIAGTIGVSTRGPSVDPIEKVMRSIARAKVLAILSDHNIKAPKKKEDTVTTPDGGTYTLDQLVDRRLAKHGETIRKEAEKELAERARKAKKLAEAAREEGADL